MRRWTIVNVLLVGIVLLLGLQIYFTWGRTLVPVDFSPRPLEAAPPRSEGGGGGGGREGRGRKRGADKPQPLTAQAMVTAIVNKDLFDPSRQKPTEETKPPPPKEVAPPPNVTVVGVRIFGKDSEAFVVDASQGNQQKRLRVGDRLGDYTIKTIDPRRVTLASPTGDLVKLGLTVEKTGAPAAPGAPRPGPAARPGQPAGSPAAGVQPAATPPPSPAAGIQPRPPRAPAGPAANLMKQPAVTTTTMPHAPNIPNLPAGVREKLEQLRQQ